VGFISQSGGHAVNATQSGMDSGIHLNKVISLGNQLDVSINEILAYMGRDETVRVIGVYVEDIRDGRAFLDLLKEIVPRKPVVVWKGGISQVGKEAAVTHTGSLAGDEKVFFAAMRQAGAICVNNMNQMIRILRVLQPQYPLLGGRLAVLTPGGGNTVNVCDLFSGQPHLSLPRLSPETMQAVRDLLPEENVDVRNPVDPGATGLLKLDKLIKAVGRDPRIDTLGLVISVDFLSNIQSEENRALVAEMISETVARLSKKIAKPIFILLRQERENHEDFDRYRRMMISKFNEKAVPWMDGSFANVAENLSKIAAYRDHLEKVRGRNTPEKASR
jgi:acyl-CoA synthetase (NDP forming)